MYLLDASTISKLHDSNSSDTIPTKIAAGNAAICSPILLMTTTQNYIYIYSFKNFVQLQVDSILRSILLASDTGSILISNFSLFSILISLVFNYSLRTC